jgi:alpha-D-ribose 1-methylphosphonate 5-triphosphate synthase subunit PhnG
MDELQQGAHHSKLSQLDRLRNARTWRSLLSEATHVKVVTLEGRAKLPPIPTAIRASESHLAVCRGRIPAAGSYGGAQV